MASEYVEKLTALLDAAEPKLPHGITVAVKHFFGGAAAYVDGRVFMSFTKVGLALKLPEADRERLFRSKRAKPLRYFPKAPVIKQYALFPTNVSGNRRSLRSWVQRSIAFTLGDEADKKNASISKRN